MDKQRRTTEESLTILRYFACAQYDKANCHFEAYPLDGQQKRHSEMDKQRRATEESPFCCHSETNNQRRTCEESLRYFAPLSMTNRGKDTFLCVEYDKLIFSMTLFVVILRRTINDGLAKNLYNNAKSTFRCFFLIKIYVDK